MTNRIPIPTGPTPLTMRFREALIQAETNGGRKIVYAQMHTATLGGLLYEWGMLDQSSDSPRPAESEPADPLEEKGEGNLTMLFGVKIRRNDFMRLGLIDVVSL